MIRKLAYSVVVFAVFLVVAELAARLVESRGAGDSPTDYQSGWQSEFFSRLFDWHEPDPDLLWRFRPGLDNPLIKTNSEGFIGDEVADVRAAQSIRILLLGDSSPVGLGLDSYRRTFGSIAERMLDAGFGGKRSVELINASVTGYSSEQIRRLLEYRGWDLDPDMVVVYCGNNDASISGPSCDRELMETQRLRWVRRNLGRLALYRVLRGVLTTRRASQDLSPEQLRVRVSAERFEENLRDIARQCRAHGCPLILLSPPVPHLWPAGLQFKSFAHVTGEDGKVILPPEIVSIVGRKLKYCLDRQRFGELYGKGDVFTRAVYSSAYNDSLGLDQALEYYQTELQTRPNDPVLLNNLGVSFWQAGRYNEADRFLKEARSRFTFAYDGDSTPLLQAAGSPILYNIGINLLGESDSWKSLLEDTAGAAYIYLDSALQADYLSLRIKREYADRLRKLGDLDGVTIIDLPTIFARNGGESLFVDHCHPTAQGHLLIAGELARVIMALTVP